MPRISLGVFAALIAFVAAPRAVAQWRCDCTTIIDSCAAEVAVRDTWIEVTTDSPQCARVDYFVDGLPFVATVVEGRGRQDWISPRADPNVLVQSCQICADNAAAASEATATEGAQAVDEDGMLVPLIRWLPEYPAAAEYSGLEGHVTVEFDVTAAGGVDNVTVAESAPDSVFDEAALNAVRRWRYVSDPERDNVHLTERIEFSIGDALWQLQPAENAQRIETPSRAPRNRCIREDAEFNYGSMIESGLISTCTEPLMVFGCAQGVGRQLGRWVCSDSERAGDLLVRPGDRRVGTTVQVGEQLARIESLRFTDNFFIARAPNSQYWWVACGLSDEPCREDARMWVRSVDRQPASVDPSQRAAITVARSF